MPKRIVPHDADAERALVGCVICGGNKLLDIAEEMGIVVESFYVAQCQYIWHAMRQVRDSRHGIDLITVQSKLQDEGMLEKAGGLTLLTHCVDVAITPSHIEHYAEVVLRDWLRRRVIQSCTEAVEQCYATPDSAEQVLADLIHTGDAIKPATRQPTSLFECCTEQVRQWKAGFQGVESRWSDLNQFIGGYRYGEMSLVAGYRGEGKSLYMCNEAYAAAKKGIPTLIVSLEMPREKIAGRILGTEADLSTFKMDVAEQHDVQREYASIDSVLPTLGGTPLWIIDGNISLDRLVREVRQHVLRHDIKMVFVDYIQLVHVPGFRGNRNTEVGLVSRTLSLCALSHRIALVALSQFNRDPDRADRAPKLSDLRDSGSLEQDARMVVLLYKRPNTKPHIVTMPDHRTRELPEYCFEVAKNNAGPVGSASFYRIGHRQKWVQASQFITPSVRKASVHTVNQTRMSTSELRAAGIDDSDGLPL